LIDMKIPAEGVLQNRNQPYQRSHASTGSRHAAILQAGRFSRAEPQGEASEDKCQRSVGF
jgi:hypothetical protein